MIASILELAVGYPFVFLLSQSAITRKYYILASELVSLVQIIRRKIWL
nr:MAG TPA: hypothetical protein [Caudoviricetes sp.]